MELFDALEFVVADCKTLIDWLSRLLVAVTLFEQLLELLITVLSDVLVMLELVLPRLELGLGLGAESEEDDSEKTFS